MKISNYEKFKGRKKILEECNFDLKDVRQHLIRECDIEKGCDLSKVMKKYKEILANEPQNSVADVLLEEFMGKIKGAEEQNDD